MPKNITRADVLDLPREVRLRLVEEIWDSLATEPSALPVPDWHRAEIDRRLARHHEDGQDVESWSKVKQHLMNDPGNASKP